MTELWYCWKCREETLAEGGMEFLIKTDISVALQALKKDPSRKGYYLCRKKHAKEVKD